MNIAEPESERTCAVERGNPQKQGFQPKPRQIEWAVNRAIEGTMDQNVSRLAAESPVPAAMSSVWALWRRSLGMAESSRSIMASVAGSRG
ncbi:hypothetical protein ACFYOV_29920 [Streptomyces sp. NPDC005931]|uniref:hypothetical protein n=1 Tax=Streptomyces sp. NPDC005931 TaxID=3364737 RepID=UPI003695A089